VRITDEDALQELRQSRAWLKDVPGLGERYKEEYQTLFHLASGKAVFWTLPDGLRENEMEWTRF
jgi:hypothetical protein